MEIAHTNFGNNRGHYSHVCNHPLKQDSTDAASGVAAFQHAISNTVRRELLVRLCSHRFKHSSAEPVLMKILLCKDSVDHCDRNLVPEPESSLMHICNCTFFRHYIRFSYTVPY